ncbi:MAG: hypothetical protein RL556_117 [Actinomycetota bacterium]|jgi:shikimate dehydrogenase
MDRKLAVLGSPIDHSKSPQIHSAAYRVLGLPWEYDRFEVRKGGLTNFISSLDDQWLGLSLTMPLKSEAFRFALETDEFAKQTFAVNTLLRTDTGWRGYNTDVFGIVESVRQARLDSIESVLIIGSGSTATSAMSAVAQLGLQIKVSVFARNVVDRDKLIDFGKALGLAVSRSSNLKKDISRTDLVIATLPAHALDSQADSLSKAWFFKPRGAVLDVAYQPWPSKFSALWTKQKLVTISGFEMLLWQAVAQIRIFNGLEIGESLPNEKAVIEAMRHAVA